MLSRFVTENEFRQTVVEAARKLGWKAYFTWNSLHSPSGYQDLTLLKGDQLIVAELKSEKGTVSKSQQEWLDAWGLFCEYSPNTHVYVWRPSQWDEIERILRGEKRGA